MNADISAEIPGFRKTMNLTMKAKDYLSHRALRRQIFQHKSKVMSRKVSTFLSVL